MGDYTKGPWVIYPETDGTEICAVEMTRGLPVRQLICRPERGENWIANAHLIAAAPELLDALERLVDSVNPESTGWSEAVAAIAKARGEA